MKYVRTAAVALALCVMCGSEIQAAATEPVGGMNFFCAAFQTIKIASLFTGQLEGVVVGAIGGGIACGMGW